MAQLARGFSQGCSQGVGSPGVGSASKVTKVAVGLPQKIHFPAHSRGCGKAPWSLLAFDQKHQLFAMGASPQGSSQRVSWCGKSRSFCNLILEVISHHLCHILFLGVSQ